eukprot:g6495.t1
MVEEIDPLALYHYPKLVARKENNWLLTDTQMRVLHKKFSELDTLNTGFIDEDELYFLAKQLGEDLTREEISNAMKRMDKSEAQKINFETFVEWWQASDDDASFYSDIDWVDTDDDTDRENLREERENQYDSAAKIQAMLRGKAERKRHAQRVQFKIDSIASAQLIANIYRGQLARRKFRSMLLFLQRNGKPLSKRIAAVMIQSLVRGNFARRRVDDIRAKIKLSPVPCEGGTGRAGLVFPAPPCSGIRPPFESCADLSKGQIYVIHGSVTKFTFSLRYSFDCDNSAEDERRRNAGLQGIVEEGVEAKGPSPSSFFRLPPGSIQYYRFGQRLGRFLEENITTTMVMYNKAGTVMEVIRDPFHSKNNSIRYLGKGYKHFRQQEEIYIRLRKMPDECAYVVYTLNLSEKIDLSEFRKLSVTAWANPKGKGKINGGKEMNERRGDLGLLGDDYGDCEMFRFELARHNVEEMQTRGNRHMVLCVMTRVDAWWKVHCVGECWKIEDEAEERDNVLNSNETVEDKRLLVWNPLEAEEYAKRFEIRNKILQYKTFAPRVLEMTVWVKAGKGLAPKDITEKSDPYFTLSWGSGKKDDRFMQSKTIMNTLNPQWNERGMYVKNITASDHREIIVTVFDFDIGKGGDFMGVAKVPTGAIFGLGLGLHEKWIPLETWIEKYDDEEDLFVKGEVQLVFKVKDAAGYQLYNGEWKQRKIEIEKLEDAK